MKIDLNLAAEDNITNSGSIASSGVLALSTANGSIINGVPAKSGLGSAPATGAGAPATMSCSL